MSRLIAVLTILAFTLAAFAQYGDISDLKLNKPEDKVDAKSEPAPKDAVHEPSDR